MESVAGVVSKTASHQRRRRTNIIPAVAFGYLERLLYIGDTGKFYEEEARLRSLSNVLNQAGFEPYLYEDFADELFNLIRSIANAIGEGNGDEVLLNAFNDETVQNYIITHFKVSVHVFHAGVQ
jgi:ubiquitin thioesterase protein OTUB1